MPEFSYYDLTSVTESVNSTAGESQQSKSFSGISTDARTIQSGELFIALHGERFDGHEFVREALEKGGAGAVVERTWWNSKPSVPPGALIFITKDSLTSLQKLAAQYRGRLDIPIVAITGTNGKTTTKELTASVLQQRYKVWKSPGNYNNQIGLPLSILWTENDHEIMVIELGANHPGEIAFLSEIAHPDTGVITNVGKGHLEYFKTVEKVAETKAELISALPPDGTAILPGNDRWLQPFCSLAPNVVQFGLSDDFDVYADQLSSDRQGCYSFMLNGKTAVHLNVPGIFNVMNALAAGAVGMLFDLSEKEIQSGLESFQGNMQRMEMLRINNVNIINDSYNANSDSVRVILQWFADYQLKYPGKKYVALGDMLELGNVSETEHFKLGRFLSNLGFDGVFLYGKESKAIGRGIGKTAKCITKHFSEKSELSEALLEILVPGDLLLLKGSRGMRMEEIVSNLRKYSE